MDEIRVSGMHTPREVKRHLIEVHVAGVCFRPAGDTIEILVAKRKANRELYPSLLEGCGGQLHSGETFMQGVSRHFYNEMHLNVEVYRRIVMPYKIKQGDRIIPGVRMLCRNIGGKAWSDNHDSVTWLPWVKFLQKPPKEFIPGLKDDMKELIGTYLAVKGALEGSF
jgi:8-oxo-dGTP pyrophosphatase MutT (NUDIX family)